jgi:hypothetical protein
MLEIDSKLSLQRMQLMFDQLLEAARSGKDGQSGEIDCSVDGDWECTRKLKLLAIACCNTIRNLLPPEPCGRAIDLAYLHVDGVASPKDLKAYRSKLTRAYNKAYAPVALGEITTDEAGLKASIESNALQALSSLLQEMEHSGCELVCTAVAEVVACTAVLNASVVDSPRRDKATETKARKVSLSKQAELMRDIFGNPFRPVSLAPTWLTPAVLALARQMYDGMDFSAMPILADALQDASCEDDAILNHCRSDGPHVRGCWVVDLVLGKE